MNSWNDGEIAYLISLLRSRGDHKVGRSRDAVASYLEVQSAVARRGGEKRIQESLYDAAVLVRGGTDSDWSRALEIVAELD